MDPLSQELIKLGLSGVVIVGLVAALLRVWGIYLRERDRSNEIQEKRISESLTNAREVTRAIEAGTDAMETLTEVVKASMQRRRS